MNNKKSIENILNQFSISTVIGFDIVVASQIYKIKNIKNYLVRRSKISNKLLQFYFQFEIRSKITETFLYNLYQNFLFKRKYKEILKS